MNLDARKKYWKTTLRYLIILVVIWIIFGLGLPILWVEPLNTLKLGGFPLGFWFSMQGSIIAFTLIVFIYAALMNRLDKKFNSSSS